MRKSLSKLKICLGIILGLFLIFKILLNQIYFFPILMYHSIDRNPAHSKIVVEPEEFLLQMEFLKKNGFRVISLEELVCLLKENKKLPRKTVAITFDDGYENNYLYAYPLLKKYNFPATIFVIVDLLDKEGYLKISQIKEMAMNGFEIGSHTHSHPWLVSLEEEKLKEEIFGSKRKLEEILGKEVKFFSYPRGGFDERVKSFVKDAGYEAGFATSYKKSFPKYDLYALKRVRISGKDSLLEFRIKVSGYYTWIKDRRDED